MPSDVVLKMLKIRKTYPGVLALDGVDFDLRTGEVHVLLGENGAGKSTLVKILSGALQKTEGEIALFGNRVNIESPRHAQRLGIGIIYQELNLVPSLTAAENIFLGRERTNSVGLIDKQGLLSSAQKIISTIGLQIECDQPVKTFGLAQRQMIEVAKALSLDARILIMDEPTSALSEIEIQQLFDVIRRLREKGVAIIYISHRLQEIFEIGDRVTVLRDGKLVGTRAIRETSHSELVKMMVNRELKDQYPRHRGAFGEEILRIEHFNRKGALRDISFSLHRGEILGISGLLGSGRTELARALFGADKIDSGEVIIRGERRRITSPRTAVKLGLGLLTEDRKSQGLVLALSVKENITLSSLDLFSKLGIISIQREEREASSFIQQLRIKTPGHAQKVLNLSGGNQQKVVLAKWLSRKADIFIFDEPTRGIDVGSKVEIYHLMNQLTAQGVAIIMISSELPEILGMSDRILIMHQHAIAGELSAEEATQERVMRYALGAA